MTGEAITLQNLFFATMAGAGVVLCGACYAMFFALGRLTQSSFLSLTGLGAYGGLVLCALLLAHALALSGFWYSVVAVMLVGYFIAPRAIWRLCEGTHGDDGSSTESTAARLAR